MFVFPVSFNVSSTHGIHHHEIKHPFFGGEHVWSFFFRPLNSLYKSKSKQWLRVRWLASELVGPLEVTQVISNVFVWRRFVWLFDWFFGKLKKYLFFGYCRFVFGNQTSADVLLKWSEVINFSNENRPEIALYTTVYELQATFPSAFIGYKKIEMNWWRPPPNPFG